MEEPPPHRALWNRPGPWFALVSAVAAILLLTGLGEGDFRPYDEGLYGKLARNALEHGRYLYAVDPEGEFFSTFSKPPLSLWVTAASLRVFGMSLAALRMPFALSTIGLIWVAFGWGRRIGGLPVAVGFSGVLTLSSATLRWGRHACIEQMFLAFVLLALWAYHEAYRGGPRSMRWAMVAGAALALGLLTKQLAIGIAVLPILALEAWRREGRAGTRRLGIALGIPTGVGAIWLGLAYAAVGSELLDTLFSVGVRDRLQGFASGHNARSLGELSGVLGEAMAPWSWPIGVAGLALLGARALAADRRKPDGALLVPFMFVTVVLVYENLASSMLPWYAFDFVPPVAGGLGFVVAAVTGKEDDLRGRAATVLGWAALALAGVAAVGTFASDLDAALVVGVVVTFALVARRWSTRATAVSAALVATAIVASAPRNEEFTRPPERFASWMTLFSERGLHRVAVLKRTGLVSHEYGTFFGPGVEVVRGKPWPTDDFDVFITPEAIPMEYEPPDGVELLRVPGAVAFVGDLSQRAYSRATLYELMRDGPITFEAELLLAEGPDTVDPDPAASGGWVRRFRPFRNEKVAKFSLAAGPELDLQGAKYEVDAYLAWSCPGVDADAATFSAWDGDRRVSTKHARCEDGTGELEPVKLEFNLRQNATVQFRVFYRTGDVALDRIVITRLPE